MHASTCNSLYVCRYTCVSVLYQQPGQHLVLLKVMCVYTLHLCM